jgi:Xaa-Pro aminopeptidase
VTVKPYDAMVPDVKSLAAAGTKIMLDPTKVSLALAEAAMTAYEEAHGPAAAAPATAGKKRKSAGADAGDAHVSGPKGGFKREGILVEGTSPVVVAKAVKNAAELAGMKEAHVRDAVALAEFFCWLEGEVHAGKKLTEVDVST